MHISNHKQQLFIIIIAIFILPLLMFIAIIKISYRPEEITIQQQINTQGIFSCDTQFTQESQTTPLGYIDLALNKIYIESLSMPTRKYIWNTNVYFQRLFPSQTYRYHKKLVPQKIQCFHQNYTSQEIKKATQDLQRFPYIHSCDIQSSSLKVKDYQRLFSNSIFLLKIENSPISNSQIFKYLPHENSLLILKNNQLNSHAGDLLFTHATHHTRIEVYQNNLGKLTTPIPELPKLKVLKLKETQLSSEDLTKILDRTPNLINLTLSHIKIDSTTLPPLSHLTSLELYHCYFSEEGILNLAKQTQLISLSLIRSRLTFPQLQQLIAQLPNLQWIDLRNSTITTDDYIQLKQQFPQLGIIYYTKANLSFLSNSNKSF